jgi:hypothetical protein
MTAKDDPKSAILAGDPLSGNVIGRSSLEGIFLGQAREDHSASSYGQKENTSLLSSLYTRIQIKNKKRSMTFWRSTFVSFSFF